MSGDVAGPIAVKCAPAAKVRNTAADVFASARRLSELSEFTYTSLVVAVGVEVGCGVTFTTALEVGSGVALAAGVDTGRPVSVGADVGRLVGAAVAIGIGEDVNGLLVAGAIGGVDTAGAGA